MKVGTVTRNSQIIVDDDGFPVPNNTVPTTESEPHVWKGDFRVGGSIRCTRCGYGVRLDDEEPDFKFMDEVVPCDELVIRQVMDV